MNIAASFRKISTLTSLVVISAGAADLAHAQIAPNSQQPPPPATQEARNPQQTAPLPPRGNLDDYSPFYNDLYPYGTWLRTARYGYVFQPFEAQGNWAPYSVGYWAFSAAGWVWMSPEPWGWATYHFGNWALIENVGWVWVPGRIWAPAWVSWRRAEYMGQVCYGWAPLPPESFAYSEEGDTVIGEDLDATIAISADYYHFLPEVCLGQHDYRPYYFENRRNEEILTHSKNITHIVIKRPAENPYLHYDQVKSGGPEIDQLKSSRPISEVTLALSKRTPGRLTMSEVPAGTVPRLFDREAPASPNEPPHLLTQEREPQDNGSSRFDSREMPPVTYQSPTSDEDKLKPQEPASERQTAPRPSTQQQPPVPVVQPRPSPTNVNRASTPSEPNKDPRRAKGGKVTPEPSPASTH